MTILVTCSPPTSTRRPPGRPGGRRCDRRWPPTGCPANCSPTTGWPSPADSTVCRSPSSGRCAPPVSSSSTPAPTTRRPWASSSVNTPPRTPGSLITARHAASPPPSSASRTTAATTTPPARTRPSARASPLSSTAPIPVSSYPSSTEPADPYPAGCLLRRVTDSGYFRYGRCWLHLDRRWAGVEIGLLREHGRLHAYYGAARIGTLIVGDLPEPVGRGSRRTAQ